MEVDAVIYYLIADPVRATYEVQNLRWGLEQLTLSALRNVIGQLDLDHTLASRDTTNSQLRAALDTATQQWGVKVMRIELKNITPPEEIRLTMEKQMTAERTRACGRHDRGRREIVGDSPRRRPEAVADRPGGRRRRKRPSSSAEGQAQARLAIAQAEAQAIQARRAGARTGQACRRST